MKPLRVIFMGTPAFSAAIFNQLLHLETRNLIEIVGVVTRADRPEGRRKVLKPSPLKKALLSIGKEQLLLETDKVKQIHPQLKARQADLIVVAAFGQILSEEVLNSSRLGSYNIHTSLLPKFRGAAPIQRAILAGCSETGVTLMQMVRGLDAGAMLKKAVISLPPYITYGELEQKLIALSESLLEYLVTQASRARSKEEFEMQFEEQNEEEVTWAEKVEKLEARIDFSEHIDSVAQKICAFDPKPGSYGFYCVGKSDASQNPSELKRIKFFGVRETMLFVQNSEFEQLSANQSPGDLIYSEGKCLGVLCGKGIVSLKEVQPEGRNKMPFNAWLRGSAQQQNIRFV